MSRISVFLALVLLCFISSVTFAQNVQDSLSTTTTPGLPEVKVEALVDKSQVTVGEKVTYTVRVDAQNNWQVEFPGYIDNLGGFVVRDFGRADPKKSGKNRYRREVWYTLDTYTTGSYVIPPLILLAKGPGEEEVKLKTPQIFVEVKTVVKERETPEDIRDIKLPLGLKADYRKFIYIALTALFCLFMLLGLHWWIKKHRKETLPPPRPAHLIALEELERIQAKKLIEKKMIKIYYYLVSMCLRHYLENRFNLKAPEQTTEEFLEAIVENNTLDSKYKGLLKDFLTHCDLVKFAKYTPQADEISNIYTAAKEFVEQTKESVREEDTGQGDKKGK